MRVKENPENEEKIIIETKYNKITNRKTQIDAGLTTKQLWRACHNEHKIAWL